MKKLVISWAEDQFTATQKKDKLALTAKENAWQDINDRVSRQRALRLAKEAADKEATENGAAKNKNPETHQRKP